MFIYETCNMPNIHIMKMFPKVPLLLVPKILNPLTF